MASRGKPSLIKGFAELSSCSRNRVGARKLDYLCQRGEIGRHDGFKIHCLHGRGGSSPPAGTIYEKYYLVAI